ncbi:MAG: hypothetical protein KGD63_04075 [Candidatus Lokiarchaeota archaeon]|nr:hypothetical protein [Candidatus Lokiarchaeota archaeon]
MYKINRIILKDAKFRTSPYVRYYSSNHNRVLLWIFIIFISLGSFFYPYLLVILAILLCVQFILYTNNKKKEKENNKNIWDTLNFEQDRIWFENKSQNRIIDLYFSDIKRIELNINWKKEVDYLTTGRGLGLLLTNIIIHLYGEESSSLNAHITVGEPTYRLPDRYFDTNFYDFIYEENTNQLHELPVRNRIEDELNIKVIQLLYLFLKMNLNVDIILNFNPNNNIPDGLIKIVEKYEQMNKLIE